MESMVAVVDAGIFNVTQSLIKKGMWNSTLMVFFGDNGGGMGGTEPSNNYPLRGTKGEPWDGAVRVAAFVSGGLVPPARRGTSLSAQISVADW
jgi:arylsulfatase A-like enzyme